MSKNEYATLFASKSGGIVQQHSSHIGLELQANLVIATFLATLGHQICLLPIVDEPNTKNPDATIDGEICEFKTNQTGTYLSVDNEIRRASKQADCILLRLSVAIDRASLENAIYNRVRQCSNVKRLYLIYHDKLHCFSREQIITQAFRGLLKG